MSLGVVKGFSHLERVVSRQYIVYIKDADDMIYENAICNFFRSSSYHEYLRFGGVTGAQNTETYELCQNQLQATQFKSQ